MNRLRKWTAILLGAAMLLVGGARPALAAGSNVEYVGGAAGFVLLPDNNLWGDMTSLLPGDVVTESFTVGNRSSASCDLYLTTRGNVEPSPLMELLELRITMATSQGKETELYSGAASGSGNAIHLGRYAAGSGATLTATLTVPVTLGNEYEHAADGAIWTFTAVEYNPPTDDDDSDDDGDSGSTVIIKTPAVVKAETLGLLPATGSGRLQ